jgi:hypothetical protein
MKNNVHSWFHQDKDVCGKLAEWIEEWKQGKFCLKMLQMTKQKKYLNPPVFYLYL